MSYQTKLDIIVKVDENRNINSVYADVDYTDILEDCVVHYGLRAIFGSIAIADATAYGELYQRLHAIHGVTSIEEAIVVRNDL